MVLNNGISSLIRLVNVVKCWLSEKTLTVCVYNPLDNNSLVRRSIDAGKTCTIQPSEKWLNQNDYGLAYNTQKFVMDPSNSWHLLLGMAKVYEISNVWSNNPTWKARLILRSSITAFYTGFSVCTIHAFILDLTIISHRAYQTTSMQLIICEMVHDF